MTALVCFGPGWQPFVDRVPEIVHEVTHERDVEAVVLGGRSWYPLVDSIVVPGMYWKKHDLFRDSDDSSSGHAAYVGTMFREDSTGIRPLAVARGFAVHKLGLLAHEHATLGNDGGAWPSVMDAAILGPYPAFIAPVGEPREVASAFSAGDVLGDRVVLWHRGWDRRAQCWRPIQFRREDEYVCSRACAYRMAPPAIDRAASREPREQ